MTFTREDPPRGGPVAGLLTGVDALLRTPALVGVLAVDMPHVTASTVRRLREAAVGRDGAFLVDRDGRRQLAGVLAPPSRGRASRPRGRSTGCRCAALLADLDLVDVPADGDGGTRRGHLGGLRDLQA